MTTGLSVAGQPSTRRLFAVYAAVSLVPVLALGFVLSTLLHRQATSAGLREGASEAGVVSRSSVAPLLDGHDLRDGLRADEASRLNSRGRLIGGNSQVLRLRLRDLAGRVVWSADGAGLGTVDDEAVEAAGGEPVTHLQWLNADVGDAGSRGPRLVEAYVPLSAAQTGSRIGVLEIYLPYAPIRASIAAGQHLLLGALIGGLFVLWLAMLGVSASVTRALRRQARTNAFLARHDPLTGLANRSQFAHRAAMAIAGCTAARQVALAVIDLDRFKEVNDTLGHGNGDQLLVALAERLSVHVREGDLVARLGGDEFGLILTGVHGPGEAVEILTRLRSVLAEPITLGALPLAVEASVGFAMAPGDGTDAEALLARADLAMYVAKREHRGVVHYRTEHDRYDAANLTLIAELAQAIARDELRLHFQPKADLRNAKVTAVDALVRWEHPVRGLLYPDAFLPAAEQTELVEPLTRWV
ncbi:MAG TPA: diguanylate cyclase, partial [Mycobacteriales bacterium]|nr:diguanylate cyclase [Mycobacteriales bacterium]